MMAQMKSARIGEYDFYATWATDALAKEIGYLNGRLNQIALDAEAIKKRKGVIEEIIQERRGSAR